MGAEKPLISIIVPIYKVEKYLPLCLESILAQTYRDIEVVAVDDGSPDDSGKIADEYAEKDLRIKVIHQPNRGLSGARNAGIEAATGEYLMFIDADDYIHPRLAELLLWTLQTTDSDIAICNAACVDDTNDPKECMSREIPLVVPDVKTGRECVAGILDQTFGMNGIVAWNKLYPSKLFNIIRFPEGRAHEDEFTTYRLLYPLQKCAYLSVELYFYLQRSTSIMGVKNRKSCNDKTIAFLEQAQYLKEQGDPLYVGRLLSAEQYLISLILEEIETSDANESYLVEWEDRFERTYKEEIRVIPGHAKQKLAFNIFRVSKRLYARIMKLRNR